MAKCKTDCIERPLSLAFEKLGRVVGRYPFVFLLSAVCVAASLGGGFKFLQESKANDIEEQFTPVNGPAKLERAIVVENFPQSEEFSQFRLVSEGTFASLIITGLHGENILTDAAFNDIIELDRRVKSISTGLNAFDKLCAKTKGRCMSNAVLDIINYNATEIVSSNIKYPMNNGMFLGTTIGGVELKPNSSEISSAKAVRLFYFLDEKKTKENSDWLDGFLKLLSNATEQKTVHVSYFTSVSRQNELETNSDSIIPLFSVTYSLAITISIMSCSRLDSVRTKVWVATFGVVSAGLAVLASFGLLLFCGMPFAMTVGSAPFLILGVGVDDMFIMISCWQKTEVNKAVEVRLAETYKEAGVSITITTLTDVMAFYIGLMTPFRSVQSFCMYTSTALLFCYIFNITFFGACLALNGRREKGNRHWLTCMKVPEATGDGGGCCVGGAYDKITQKEFEMPVDSFFKNYYGPFLTRAWVKTLVCVIYAGYLAVSIYGCFQMQEGLDLKHLAADGSYVGSYYDKEDEFFSSYGPNVMLVIKDEDFQYWNPTARKSLDLCLENFQNLTMARSGIPPVSWLNSYMQFGQRAGVNLDNEMQFKSYLTAFLNQSGFSQDVNFTNSQIHASRMFIPTVNIRTAVDEKNMLNAFRETAEKCGKLQTPVDLIVYHAAFIYFDQYAVIISNTIQNLVVATCVMLVISLLLIPNPLCSLWVTISIASVIVGVAGFMALWDVSLDSVSMINLVICIGFSVDFSAHICYAFVSSEQSSVNEKATDALTKLGYPIIQGAVSTIAGVVVLSTAKSYLFRTFFKIMFLVILFGAVHGLVFIPVFLTFLSTCSSSQEKNKTNLPKQNHMTAFPQHSLVSQNESADPDCY
ncbi:patched domain-containing protein 3-like [Megalobrama amblycephala]|uniref:patched domain-containing protein 3-like n=1 Tax=Megalobrama amblycephala TaxID=75352 RepID=UPI00201434E0|nr:patched domain-containing protein 3-like [Megalobrama amblycephala]XP_048016284.1 patched domain-containing protein 3-like [Megalobrama amblycephala]